MLLQGTGSPDSIKLASIMNGPLSADASPLSLDQLSYNPSTDMLGSGMYVHLSTAVYTYT